MSIRSALLMSCAALAFGTVAPTASLAGAPAIAAPPLTLAGSTDVPNYTGDFDHFAIDEGDGRLFLAGEEHHELDVFDLATGALQQRLEGYGAPHSPLMVGGAGELLVVDGEKPSPVLNASTLAVQRSYALPAGADSIAYDASEGRVWIVTGGKDVPQKDSNLISVDPKTGQIFTKVHFDADHVEALAVEQSGGRLFINVTDKNVLDVIDKKTGRIEHSWKIHEAEQNAPLAMDETTHRLFVVTRKPGMLLVLNADSGATVASFTAPARTDQVTWDPQNRRIYVTGGEGYISVVQQNDADHYVEVARVPSLPGAKTAILDSSHHRLYVAASPGDTGAMGKLIWYDVAPR